jgi:hypothetical protein
MIVAFCSTAMNRRWQLERTLRSNLEVLRGTGSFLALCDYNSAEPLDTLVQGFAEDLRTGTLLYFRTEEPTGYHSSKAKNLAHRLALRRSPDVLFNLDADNFLSDDTLGLVSEAFASGERLSFHNWTTRDADGTCGRLALRAEDWVALGGYDEQLQAASWQDIDLLIRCRAAGLRYLLDPRGVPRPIANSMAEKLAHLEGTGEGDPMARYYAMYKENLIISMGRPARLRLEDQRRFSGRLNLTEGPVAI